MAFEDYLYESIGAQLMKDRLNPPVKRRLLMVTLRGAETSDFKSFRRKLTTIFVPWLNRRLSLRRWIGIVIPADLLGAVHAHVVVDADRHFPGLSTEWQETHPRCAPSWAAAGQDALRVELLRGRWEIRPDRGGPILDLRALPYSPGRDLVERSTIGGIRYLAQQVPPVEVPRGSRFVMESDDFGELTGGFAEYRDRWIDLAAKRPFSSGRLESDRFAGSAAAGRPELLLRGPHGLRAGDPPSPNRTT